MALDNVETRSYVNNIAMTLDIPVLDAGIFFILTFIQTFIHTHGEIL